MIRGADHNIESQSRIGLFISSSTGTWLNGALCPQHNYIHLQIDDPEGKRLCEIAMTFDQFTHMLVSNMSTLCTLLHYRDKDGEYKEEKVEPVESVSKRMTKRMGKVHEELSNRVNDLYQDVYEMVNSGKAGKTKLKELLQEIKCFKDSFISNQNFTLQQGQEELDDMQNNMRSQLMSFVNKLGGNVNEETIKKLEGQPREVRLIEAKEEPTTTGYQRKERESKAISEMSSMEVADQLSMCLRRLENWELKYRDEATKKDKYKNLFGATSWHQRSTVYIKYKGYQSESKLSLEEAKAYLVFLRTVKTMDEFKTHWCFKNLQDQSSET